MENTERFSSVYMFIISFSFLVFGLVFTLLGLTIFPIFGLIIGVPCIVLALSPILRQHWVRPVKVLVGSRSRDPQGSSFVPVSVLSTSTSNGESYDFDASTINPGTVEFGPYGLKPVDDMSDPVVMDHHLSDVDGDGDRDLLFYFHMPNSSAGDPDSEICITGKTVGGEEFKGCGKFALEQNSQS